MENKVCNICSEVHLHHLFMGFELMSLPYAMPPKQMPERLSPVTEIPSGWYSLRCSVFSARPSPQNSVEWHRGEKSSDFALPEWIEGWSGYMTTMKVEFEAILPSRSNYAIYLILFFYIFQARRHILKTALNGQLILLYSFVTDWSPGSINQTSWCLAFLKFSHA